MAPRELLLISISFLAGLICIQLFRRLDRYEREPFGKMVLAAVLGGGCAVIIALVLFDAVANFGFKDFESTLGALLFIGPIEELAKLAGLFIILTAIRGELNEPADGIIYMACVALGFSLVENVLYAAQPGQAALIVIRLLVATPMHIGFSTLMGISFYLWYRNRRAYSLLIVAYLLASLSHGLWDLIIFNQYSTLLLGGTFCLIYSYARNLFLYALTISPHRLSLAQSMEGVAPAGSEAGTACLNCGDDGDKPLADLSGIKIAHCTSCDHYNLASGDLYRLFYHFAGVFKRTAKRRLEPSARGEDWLTLFGGNDLSPAKMRAVFRLTELDSVLERLNYATKARLRSKWYLPRNLERLDHPEGRIDFLKFMRDALVAFERRLASPFGDGSKKAHHLPDGGTPWNWGAFLVPELWYAAKGLWGAVILVALIYLITIAAAVRNGENLALILGATAALVRWASGLWGARLYYRRQGRWP